MNMSPIQPDDAAAALQQVRASQAQVFAVDPFPGWYWPVVAGAGFVFTLGVESRRPLLITVCAVAFALGIGASVLAAISRQRVQPRSALIGLRGAALIAGSATGLVAVGLALGFVLRTLATPYPVTIAMGVAMALMALTGPWLGRALQRTMAVNAARGR